MSVQTRKTLTNKIYDALEEIGDDIRPSEVYGVLETVKMDVHDGAVKEIEKARKENRNPRWIH